MDMTFNKKPGLANPKIKGSNAELPDQSVWTCRGRQLLPHGLGIREDTWPKEWTDPNQSRSGVSGVAMSQNPGT